MANLDMHGLLGPHMRIQQAQHEITKLMSPEVDLPASVNDILMVAYTYTKQANKAVDDARALLKEIEHGKKLESA